MPLLSRTFIKTALVYFMPVFLLGLLLSLQVSNNLFPVYIHLLVFGWLTQLIFGVVYWKLPKYSNQLPRGREALSWITYGTLNIGLVLHEIAEPLQASLARYLFDRLPVLSPI